MVEIQAVFFQTLHLGTSASPGCHLPGSGDLAKDGFDGTENISVNTKKLQLQVHMLKVIYENIY